MKLFAAICGTAALMTSGVSYYILYRFGTYYEKMGIPLPELTEAILWKGGVVPPTLLFLCAVTVFTGLVRKNNPLIIGGGVSTLLLMLGAATLVPTALMLPMEERSHEGETGLMRPANDPFRDEKDSIRD